MIKDTPEYKEGMQLWQLHETYKKHVFTFDDGTSPTYGHHICSGCGMPFDAHSQSTEPALGRGYHDNMTRAQTAMLYDIAIEKGRGLPEILNGSYMKLKGAHDISHAKDLLLKGLDDAPYAGYMWAIHVNPADTNAVIEQLCNIACGKDTWRGTKHRAAQAIYAICKRANVKAPRRMLKGIIAKLYDMESRVGFAKLHGVKYTNVIKVRDEFDSRIAYDYVKENYPDKFKDAAYMNNLLRGSYDHMRYLRDTGSMLGNDSGFHGAARAKFLGGKTDGLIDMYKALLSGDKDMMAKKSDSFDSDDIKLLLADSMDKLLEYTKPRVVGTDVIKTIEQNLGLADEKQEAI